MALSIPPTTAIDARARLERTQIERAREQYDRVRFEQTLRDQQKADEQLQLESAQQQHAAEVDQFEQTAAAQADRERLLLQSSLAAGPIDRVELSDAARALFEGY